MLLAVPLAVTGALLALWATGSTMNLYSQIGMILLIGLAAKNSILLVEYINHLKGEGMELVEAVLEAGRIRLRPILMTSVAALLGAVPIAFGLGAGSASRRPLGLAVVGGLIFSTVFTLYLVPVVYIVLERMRARFSRSVRPRAPVARPLAHVAAQLVIVALLVSGVASSPGGAAASWGLLHSTPSVCTLSTPLAVTHTGGTLHGVTLADALQKAQRVDVSLIAASGEAETTTRMQRAARTALFLPALSASTDMTHFSAPAFNIGTLQAGNPGGHVAVTASYDVSLGGQQLARLRQAKAAGARADAMVTQARYGTALTTTVDFYNVVTARELLVRRNGTGASRHRAAHHRTGKSAARRRRSQRLAADQCWSSPGPACSCSSVSPRCT